MKLVSHLLTPVFFIFFGLTLLIFHPIQWFCHRIIGYTAHKKSVDWLNYFLIKSTHILGTTYNFKGYKPLPTNKPLIIIANHQSLFDIPPIIWHFRKHHVKFVSKKELGKGIPSVSYNLRHGGSALIDRKNAKKSIEIISDFAKYIAKHNRAAMIFPEGTRSKTGHPRPFKTKGLITLFEDIETAIVLPITINNSWKMFKYGKYPMGIGSTISYTLHEPIALETQNHETMIKHVETSITSAIQYE